MLAFSRVAEKPGPHTFNSFPRSVSLATSSTILSMRGPVGLPPRGGFVVFGAASDFTHGKVVDVGRRERRTDARRRGGNQAVSLVQGNAPHGMRAPPGAGPHSLGCSQRRNTQSVEKPSCRELFAGTKPTPDLLDRDRACPWFRAHASQSGDTERSRPASKRVDEHGRIQQEPSHRQPERRQSPCLCRRTHIAGSSSHSCPESDTELPRAGRARRPARRPVLCVCAWAEVSTHKRTRRPVLAGHTQGRRAERGSTALSRAGPPCPALCFPLRGRRESPRNSRAEARVLDPLSLFSIIGSVFGTGIAGAGADGAKR